MTFETKPVISLKLVRTLNKKNGKMLCRGEVVEGVHRLRKYVK
jgi:hypothetical protein